ncbi:hypothetical protein C8J57DRAFT_1255446 [Mycena rebaudengoi]|nr:hypothetical protein C8J57DRAFT_1255446 [Mycena rebaudengoi]
MWRRYFGDSEGDFSVLGGGVTTRLTSLWPHPVHIVAPIGPGLDDGPKGPPPGREIPGCGVLPGMPENVRELPCSRLWELPAAEGGTENFGQELPDKKRLPGSSRACTSGTTWPPKAELKILAGSSQMSWEHPQMSWEHPQMSRHAAVSGVLSSPKKLFLLYLGLARCLGPAPGL